MNTVSKSLIVVALAGAIAGTLALKQRQTSAPPDAAVASAAAVQTETPPAAALNAGIPRLVDLGADKCIPCKMMAPILAALKEDFAGSLDVEFIDVWKNPDAGAAYGIDVIPTQIFYAASGEELRRHTGFIGREDILAAWKELGVDLGPGPDAAPAFSRWEPAQPDTRAKDRICYLCDGDIAPETRAVLKTPAGEVGFCSVHCYLITYASMTEPNKTHENASVNDAATGALVPVMAASYLQGMDASGRPAIRAFATEAAARAAQGAAGGNVIAWAQVESLDTAIRCGFCDRPVYAVDATVVRAAGIQTWGCCVMCALGVAARSGQDIEVEAKDALTGEAVRLSTFEGHVATLEPETAVAWAGAIQDGEGKIKSTGCFKQAFFTTPENLLAWVESHPTATGRQVSLEQALAEKMKLTPEQISKACKIGECTPK
jgi:thioredoxin 1